MKLSLVALCALFLTSTLVGQEKNIQRGDLPAAVRSAADAQSRGATVIGYAKEIENGRLSYEVQLKVNGHSKDVSFSPDGKVQEIEEQVDPASLPSEVAASLKAKAGKGEIAKVESLTKNGKLVAYEAQVKTSGKRSEIQVGPRGEKLAHAE
jgi:hypothetical protein